MTAPLWAGLVLLGFGAAAFYLPRLPPRQALAVVVLLAAGGLAIARLLALAVPLAAFGIGLWRSAGAGAIPTPGGSSEVATARLRMTLDHATGEMDGEITAGSLAGARLSQLSPEDLQAAPDRMRSRRGQSRPRSRLARPPGPCPPRRPRHRRPSRRRDDRGRGLPHPRPRPGRQPR